jgi:hypothetical protein
MEVNKIPLFNFRYFYLTKPNLMKLILFLSVIFGINYAYAQVSTPKYSNEFLNIGVGARSLGMANASISNVDDVTAGYWNPTGLLKSKYDMEIGLLHSDYFAGIAKYDYLGFSKRIDANSVAGISVIRFGVDDIPNTTELIDKDGNVDYDRITTFSAADYGFIFSYARANVIKGLSAGANVKVIHRRIGDFAQAWGFGIDLSSNYKYKGWEFAAVIKDVTTTVNAWSFNLSDEMKATFDSTGNVIPQNSTELTIPRLVVGASKYIAFNEKYDLLGEFDLDFTFDGKRNTLIGSSLLSAAPKLGFEFGYKRVVYLRTGIGNIQWVKQITDEKKLSIQPNIGIGLKIKNFYIDYALTDIGNTSIALYSNVFSVRYGIGK